MADRKTQATNASVRDFIDTVPDETRRRDAVVTAELSRRFQPNDLLLSDIHVPDAIAARPCSAKGFYGTRSRSRRFQPNDLLLSDIHVPDAIAARPCSAKGFYKYANGKDAEICRIGFAPRAKALVFYLARFDGKAALLHKLGRHSVRGGCLHIPRLDDVDMDVLRAIIAGAYSQN